MSASVVLVTELLVIIRLYETQLEAGTLQYATPKNLKLC